MIVQSKLFGGEEEKKVDEDERMSELKSSLQKAIRRGEWLRAMVLADELAKKNWWMAWRRLAVIAQEDCLSAESVTAVGELYRSFMFSRRDKKNEELSWDERRTVMAAAYLLAVGKKNRIADEVLDFKATAEKSGGILKDMLESLLEPREHELDMHTKRGREKGRDEKYFYEEGAKVEGKIDSTYLDWRNSPYFVELMKRKGVVKG